MSNSRIAQGADLSKLQLVGSNVYGRYPEISVQHVFNMYETDDTMVPFAGYQFVKTLGGVGRGIYSSIKSQLLFAVADSNIFKVNTSLISIVIGNIGTFQGDVFISEDTINNVAFCDKLKIYIYNYVTGQFYTPGTSPYNTGTITQSGTTVVGSGTAFTTAMVGGTIYFGGNSSATIIDRIDSTHITVSISQSLSSQGYLIMLPLDFIPNNITFQDSRFVATSSNLANGMQQGQWRLSDIATVVVGSTTYTYVTFPATAAKTGVFQTKADLPVAPVTFPGRGNLLFIMGSIVSEPWTDYGLAIFPYQKSTSYNVDYGCINPATISYLDNIVCWVGYNERSGLVIMYTTGGDVQSISTDGINYQLSHLTSPTTCYGMSYKQDGHLFYIVTFYDPADNISIVYDFTTQKFYTVTDEEFDYFIAKKIVFFNNKYYFISINDGDLYQISSDFYTYQYSDAVYDIPMEIITPTYDMPNNVPAILNSISFIIEQGVDPGNTQENFNIDSVTVINEGSGYSIASIAVTGDGVGASLTPVISGGRITGAVINNHGVGYTYAYITVSGDGSGADLVANLSTGFYNPRIGLSVSYDGGHLFSSYVHQPLNRYGDYQSRVVFYGIGYSNKFTFRFRFYSQYRIVVKNGDIAGYS